MDNVKVNPSTAIGAVAVAADEVTIDGDVAVAQRIKVVHGVPGQAVDTSKDNGLPTTSAPLAANALTSVDADDVTVTLKASNPLRRALKIYNASSAVMYVKDGAGASASSYTLQIGPHGYYEYPLPIYTGVVTACWAEAVGAAKVTEGT